MVGIDGGVKWIKCEEFCAIVKRVLLVLVAGMVVWELL